MQTLQSQPSPVKLRTRVRRVAATLTAIFAVLFSGPLLTQTTSVQYVKLEALAEMNGNPWSSMTEFNLLDTGGAVIPRTGWSVSADSVETQAEDGSVANAIDGDLLTIWHTEWSTGSPPPPHSFVVNLGSPRAIGGFKYLPPPAGNPNGNIASGACTPASTA